MLKRLVFLCVYGISFYILCLAILVMCYFNNLSRKICTLFIWPADRWCCAGASFWGYWNWGLYWFSSSFKESSWTSIPWSFWSVWAPLSIHFLGQPGPWGSSVRLIQECCRSALKIFYLRVRVDHVYHGLLLNFIRPVRFQSVLKFIEHSLDTVRVVFFILILQDCPNLFSYFLMILFELLVLLV